MASLANSSQKERRGEALGMLCVTVDVLFRGRGATAPGASTAPTLGPNTPERWKELGVFSWNGQRGLRANQAL